MSRIIHGLRGVTSYLQHRYSGNAEQLSSEPTGEVSEHLKQKLEKLGVGGKDNFKNTSRLETFAAEMAQIQINEWQKRSAMVSLLAARLTEIANSFDHSLTESHIQEMCRLLFEHTCHTAYRDTPEAKWPGMSFAKQTHSNVLWHCLDGGDRREPPLSQKNDTGIVSIDARIDVINTVKACLAKNDGSQTSLPFNATIQQYLGDLLRHNIERLNKQSPTTEQVMTLKTALKDAALSIVGQDAADENRFTAAAMLLHGSVSISRTEEIQPRNVNKAREQCLRNLPSLPPNPRIKPDESTVLYNRKYYQKPDHLRIPVNRALFKDLRETIMPVYQMALQHSRIGQDNFTRLSPLKAIVNAHIESIKTNVDHAIRSSNFLVLDSLKNELIGLYNRFTTQLDKNSLTADELTREVDSFLFGVNLAMASLRDAVELPVSGPAPRPRYYRDPIPVTSLAPPPPYGRLQLLAQDLSRTSSAATSSHPNEIPPAYDDMTESSSAPPG